MNENVMMAAKKLSNCDQVIASKIVSWCVRCKQKIFLPNNKYGQAMLRSYWEFEEDGFETPLEGGKTLTQFVV